MEIELQGEYWFDENGNTMYADGDVGDMNHEAYVIQRCVGEITSIFDIYSEDNILESDTWRN